MTATKNDVASTVPTTRLATTFRSLRIRNYRLFFIGLLVSICGTWMQGTVQATYVLFRLGGGGRELGILTACTFLPVLTIGLWAGAVVDRVDKRKLLIRAQTVMMFAAILQTAAVATGRATFPVLCSIAAITGIANAFDLPGRQAFTSELVGPVDFSNAVGLNSAIFNSGRIVGQGLGGVLVTTVGYSWCFGINALSYLAIIVSLLMMRPHELFTMARAVKAKGQVREGLRYVASHPVLRSVLLLVLLVGTLSMNFQVYLPLLAKVVFRGKEHKVALFQVLMGVGSLAGSLHAAGRKTPSPRVLIVAVGAFGLSLAGLAISPWEPLTWVLLSATGAAFITFMLTCNATLQLSSDPDRRGRVMAVYGFTFAGTTPIGAPLVGWIADTYGARESIALGAAAALAACFGAYQANRRGLMTARRPGSAEPATPAAA